MTPHVKIVESDGKRMKAEVTDLSDPNKRRKIGHVSFSNKPYKKMYENSKDLYKNSIFAPDDCETKSNSNLNGIFSKTNRDNDFSGDRVTIDDNGFREGQGLGTIKEGGN